MLTESLRMHSNVKKISLHQEPVVIHVTGEIDEDDVEQFGKDLAAAQNTGQPVVPIIINSGGGEVYPLLAMMSLMEQSKLPIATIVPGFAASAACALFACGSEGYRYMAKNARLMMHDVSQMMCGTMTLRDVDIEKTEMKQLNRQIFRAMALSCGKKPSYFDDMVTKKGGDLYMSAAQAKKHGLCNHITIPHMQTRVDYSITFGMSEDVEKDKLEHDVTRDVSESESDTDDTDDEEEEEEEDEKKKKKKREKDNADSGKNNDVKKERGCKRVRKGEEKEKEKEKEKEERRHVRTRRR
jgi:ATP-dependent Clp endopeptidase proteolytic subunit ClpP